MSLTRMTAEYNEIKKAYQAKLQLEMKQAFKTFFEEQKDVIAIVWTQYTPHFNDGETCYFGVHEFGIVKDVQELEALQEGEIGYYDLIESNSGHPAVQKFLFELNHVPREIFEETFGDHAMITATKDGFEVIEYEHD